MSAVSASEKVSSTCWAVNFSNDLSLCCGFSAGEACCRLYCRRAQAMCSHIAGLSFVLGFDVGPWHVLFLQLWWSRLSAQPAHTSSSFCQASKPGREELAKSNRHQDSSNVIIRSRLTCGVYCTLWQDVCFTQEEFGQFMMEPGKVQCRSSSGTGSSSTKQFLELQEIFLLQDDSFQ